MPGKRLCDELARFCLCWAQWRILPSAAFSSSEGLEPHSSPIQGYGSDHTHVESTGSVLRSRDVQQETSQKGRHPFYLQCEASKVLLETQPAIQREPEILDILDTNAFSVHH